MLATLRLRPPSDTVECVPRQELSETGRNSHWGAPGQAGVCSRSEKSSEAKDDEPRRAESRRVGRWRAWGGAPSQRKRRCKVWRPGRQAVGLSTQINGFGTKRSKTKMKFWAKRGQEARPECLNNEKQKSSWETGRDASRWGGGGPSTPLSVSPTPCRH